MVVSADARRARSHAFERELKGIGATQDEDSENRELLVPDRDGLKMKS
jgi:hypothetical protein